MSIVALKRKARGNKVPISKKGFSLYGGHRNKGWVGQNSLIDVGYMSSNDSSIVKKTTMTTRGYIEKRRLCCSSFVDRKRYLTQDQYIRNVSSFEQTNRETRLCSGNGNCSKSIVMNINGHQNGAYDSYDIYYKLICA